MARRNDNEDIAIMIDGEPVAAKMRHRQRRAKGKQRDLDRREARRAKREREWA